MDSNQLVNIHTYGCKVNTYDSSLIQKNIKAYGLPELKHPLHILNTCAVTAEATKEAVKAVRRLKAKDPFCTVVVTGCAAQVDTGVFDINKAADLVVANSHKSMLPELLNKYYKGEIQERVFKSNIFRKEDLEEGGGREQEHTRAFLKIQDGCNSFCTYCIIPYARGKSRSIPIRSLVSRVQELSLQGYQEVVLTGVHIGDYEDVGLPDRRGIEDLLEAVLQRTNIQRIRLTSFEPVEISDRLLELYQDPRMCPHLHMSIQSANSDVLKLMKRNYSQKQVIEALEKIHAKIPNVFVGMDVIVGFPSETHEQFEDTYLTLAKLPWSRIHVFPYSVRQGTRAAAIANLVSDREKQTRSLRLRELSQIRLLDQARAQIGKSKQALLLKAQARGGNSLTRDYWSVKIENTQGLQVGKEYDVQIKSFASLGLTDVYLEGALL